MCEEEEVTTRELVKTLIGVLLLAVVAIVVLSYTDPVQGKPRPSHAAANAPQAQELVVTRRAGGAPAGDLLGDHYVTTHTRCAVLDFTQVGMEATLDAVCADQVTVIRPWAVPLDPAPTVALTLNGAAPYPCRLSVLQATDRGVQRVIADCSGSTP